MPAKSDLRVGLVGSGPVAALTTRRLAAAFARPSLFDPLHGEDLLRLVDEVVMCGSLKELRPCVDFVVTMLDDEQELRDVLFGPDGLAQPGARPASPLTVLDLSPGTPWVLQDLIASCRSDAAAVFGGRLVTLWKNGEACTTLYVDRDAARSAELQPVLGAIADKVVLAGTPGSAKSVGILTDLLVGVNAAVTREALAIALSFGLDAGTLTELLLKGSGATQVMAERAGSGRSKDTALDFGERSGLCTGLKRAVSAALRVDHSTFFGSVGIASLLVSAHVAPRSDPAGARRG